MNTHASSCPWEEVPLQEVLRRTRLETSVAGLRLKLETSGVQPSTSSFRIDLLAGPPVQAVLPELLLSA